VGTDRTRLDLGASATDLSGEVDLRIIAGVLARCDLLVGGDTPLLQLAAAVGTAVVGLFGPTDGRVRGPYGRDHRVIQALTPRPSNGTLPADMVPDGADPGRRRPRRNRVVFMNGVWETRS
jgi:ADP-heptose:LPS heptosyltransferase